MIIMDDFDIIMRALENVRDREAAIAALRRIKDHVSNVTKQTRKAKNALSRSASANRDKGCC